jgi:hypothetical protein
MKKHKDIKHLPYFIPLKYCNLYFIDPKTFPITIERLITEAKKTRIFTIVPHYDFLLNKKIIQIEIIQECQSTILSVERSSSYPSNLSDIISELFAVIFTSSNLLHVWGNVEYEILDYTNYGFFSKVQNPHLILRDSQEGFKRWYNNTFHHSEGCEQILDYDDIDGPFCSCPHRPYKSPNDKWSLATAIAYTFHEYLDVNNDSLNECLAITKLSNVVHNRWTIEELETYKHIEHNYSQLNN